MKTKNKPAQYWRSLSSDEKQILSDEVYLDKIYLGNVMKGHFKCTLPVAVRIEDQTSGHVTKRAMLNCYKG